MLIHRKLILFAISLVILTGCAGQTSDCQIEHLILKENMFPENTHVEPIISPIPDEPKESFAQGFFYPPDDVSYMVTRWHSKNKAQAEFKSVKKIAFIDDQYRGPWKMPDEIFYNNTTADKYFVACGDVDGSYQCRMVATYEEYLVYLRTSISDVGIDFSILNQLLQNVDEIFIQCMN